jgi:hypothetical protein
MVHGSQDPSPSRPGPGTSGRLRRLLAVVVFAGSMAVFASPAAAAGGAISGTVTNNAASPAPLDGICVEALNPSTGTVVSDVLTDSSGQYTVAGLAAGSYKVEFYDCGTTGYITQYFKNQSSLASANPVSVTTGSTTNAINAKMVLGAKITGTVTNNAATPTALANICVQALNASNVSVADTRTDSSGHYALLRLPTGSYKVDFYDCSGAGYLTQFYNNQSSLATANTVSVTAGTTKSAINAKMVLGGKITGVVTNNASTPALLAQMCVSALPAAGGLSLGSADTGSNGHYTIIGLPAGSYKVEFSDCSSAGYLTQYYNNEPSLATGNPVSVTLGSATSGIGAKMVLGGKIAGTVTNNASTPAPLANMCVDVYQAASSSFVTTVHTNSVGKYVVTGLPGGLYKVEFFDCAGGIYVSQYYNNQATLAAANPVSVTGAATTSGINARLKPGGKISGTVTDSATTQPLANICVDALDSTGTFVGGASTNSSGQYTIPALPVASYKVMFVGCSVSGYLTAFYSGKSTLAAANPVSVASSTTTSGINEAMVK